jgi:hypothetical protein
MPPSTEEGIPLAWSKELLAGSDLLAGGRSASGPPQMRPAPRGNLPADRLEAVGRGPGGASPADAVDRKVCK